MTKAKTQPEEVVEAEAEQPPEQPPEPEVVEAPVVVLPGGNEPGVLPPSLQ